MQKKAFWMVVFTKEFVDGVHMESWRGVFYLSGNDARNTLVSLVNGW